jgi:hypothetical protein
VASAGFVSPCIQGHDDLFRGDALHVRVKRRLDVIEATPDDARLAGRLANPQSEQSGTLTLDQVKALSSAVAVIAASTTRCGSQQLPGNSPA